MTLSSRARDAARRLGVARQPDVEYVPRAVAAPLGRAVCGNRHLRGTISAAARTMSSARSSNRALGCLGQASGSPG